MSYRILLVSTRKASAATTLLTRIADRRRVIVTAVMAADSALPLASASTTADASCAPGVLCASATGHSTVDRLARAGFTVDIRPIEVPGATPIAQLASADTHDLMVLDFGPTEWPLASRVDADVCTLVRAAATPIMLVNGGGRRLLRDPRAGRPVSVLVAIDGSDGAALALLALTAFADATTTRVTVSATAHAGHRLDLTHNAVVALRAAGFAASVAVADDNTMAAFTRNARDHDLVTVGASRGESSPDTSTGGLAQSVLGVVPAVLVGREPTRDR